MIGYEINEQAAGEREEMLRRQQQQPSLQKSLENDHPDLSEQPGDTMSRNKSREVGGTV